MLCAAEARFLRLRRPQLVSPRLGLEACGVRVSASNPEALWPLTRGGTAAQPPCPEKEGSAGAPAATSSLRLRVASSRGRIGWRDARPRLLGCVVASWRRPTRPTHHAAAADTVRTPTMTAINSTTDLRRGWRCQSRSRQALPRRKLRRPPSNRGCGSRAGRRERRPEDRQRPDRERRGQPKNREHDKEPDKNRDRNEPPHLSIVGGAGGLVNPCEQALETGLHALEPLRAVSTLLPVRAGAGFQNALACCGALSGG